MVAGAAVAVVEVAVETTATAVPTTVAEVSLPLPLVVLTRHVKKEVAVAVAEIAETGMETTTSAAVIAFLVITTVMMTTMATIMTTTVMMMIMMMIIPTIHQTRLVWWAGHGLMWHATVHCLIHDALVMQWEQRATIRATQSGQQRTMVKMMMVMVQMRE